MAATVHRRTIVRWLGVLVAIPIVVFVLATVIGGQATATVDFQLLQGSVDPLAFPSPLPRASVEAQAALVSTSFVLDGACRRLPSPPPDAPLLNICAKLLGRELSVGAEPVRGVVRLVVRASSPQVAATRARALAASMLAVSAASATSEVQHYARRVRLARRVRARAAAGAALAGVTGGMLPQILVSGPTSSSGHHPLMLAVLALAVAILVAAALMALRGPGSALAPMPGRDWDAGVDDSVQRGA